MELDELTSKLAKMNTSWHANYFLSAFHHEDHPNSQL